MAETEPKFLDRLKIVFAEHHIIGVDEQYFTENE
jgi:hypothetical protein